MWGTGWGGKTERKQRLKVALLLGLVVVALLDLDVVALPHGLGGLLLLGWSGGAVTRHWLLLVWPGRGVRVSFHLLAV